MFFDWFFKGHFGGNRRKDVFQSDDDTHEFDDKCKDELLDESFDVPFIDPFGTLEDTSHDIFQRMDDMLSRMFSSSFASFSAENFAEHFQTESDPRRIMLKEPDYGAFDPSPSGTQFETKEPALLVDSDIDDKVAKQGLLLEANPENNTDHNFSYKKFSSIRTVRLLVRDGTKEEHRSITDNEGNTTTTVRRSIRDQSHEITTYHDAKGLKEKQENFINLDENDLHEFEKRWQSTKARDEQEPSLDTYLKPPTEILTPPTGDPLYSTLFKKFFGI